MIAPLTSANSESMLGELAAEAQSPAAQPHQMFHKKGVREASSGQKTSKTTSSFRSLDKEPIVVRGRTKPAEIGSHFGDRTG